jgi:hypothetical protein
MTKLISAMLGIILPNLSAEIKSEAKEAILRLETKAKATKNPFDDLGVILLKGLINID